MPTVVFDTNVVLRLILPSQRDAAAEALWQRCAQLGVDVVIPSQGISEAMASIRRHVFEGRLSAMDGDQLFEELKALVLSVQIERMQLGAWEVAKRFNRPDTYDSEFYALAEALGVELWTADDKFVNAMGQQRPPWVKRLTDV
ncbi:MAG TPA: type II toxin-antitoxin system VapC family toxin [Dehalococcoidia bacterium]|nr:type II toxin-antitoxin system VapC family toxin [Dehalococcoidia bacterium]